MRLAPLLFLACFACLALQAGAQTFGSNDTKAYANTTIHNALNVINAVNESGYLIFYPNLTQAYADINQSMALYNNSPSAAVVLANKASLEADNQYMQISTYRQESIVVMLALTAVFAYAVMRVVTPVSAKRKQKKQRK